MQSIIDILGILIMSAFGILCLFGIPYSIMGIYQVLKMKKEQSKNSETQNIKRDSYGTEKPFKINHKFTYEQMYM